MISARYKAAFSQWLNPLALRLVRVGISPSFVTCSGLALVVASCLFLLVTGHLLVFCVLVTAGGLFDVLDGAVARVSGRVTKFGAYLDAVCDRYAEGLVILTVAVVTGYWLLSGVGLLGALLISYTKARAAMEVPVSNQEWPDFMERGERDVLYIVGLAVSRVVPWAPLGRDLFWWTLVVLCVLIHVTVVQRILRARRLIWARGNGG